MTYNIPFSAESVDTEDALKAGQVVEPCRDTQESAIAAGVLKAAKVQNKIVLLDGHVFLRRGFPICTFIALYTGQRCWTNNPNGTASPFGLSRRQTTQSCKSFKARGCSKASISLPALVCRSRGVRIEGSGTETKTVGMDSVRLGIKGD